MAEQNNSFDFDKAKTTVVGWWELGTAKFGVVPLSIAIAFVVGYILG